MGNEASPQRKSIRLPGYDYSQNGAYFVTICTDKRIRLLSEITAAPVGADALISPQIVLSEYGRIVYEHIQRIPGINKYVIMPNHVHLIIIKDGSMRASTPTSLAQDIRAFKGIVTKRIGHSIWQRGFYEHVIRNDKDYLAAWQYIDLNPAKWAEDEYYIYG